MVALLTKLLQYCPSLVVVFSSLCFSSLYAEMPGKYLRTWYKEAQNTNSDTEKYLFSGNCKTHRPWHSSNSRLKSAVALLCATTKTCYGVAKEDYNGDSQASEKYNYSETRKWLLQNLTKQNRFVGKCSECIIHSGQMDPRMCLTTRSFASEPLLTLRMMKYRPIFA